MTMRSGGFLLVFAALLAAGCAGRRDNSPPPISREVLTRAQIDEAHATNAYEAVERLRSRWLRQRGTTQMPATGGGPQFRENPIAVYLDDQRLGTLEALRTIEVAAIRYIRFFPPVEAAARWGFNHGGGVIFVSTRPG
jgi:hypothetical protein